MPDIPALADIADIHDTAFAERLQNKLDRKTKPLGALGRLEALALRIGIILGGDTPQLQSPQLVVFAGDHGLAAQGVSAYPSDVTWQMVHNFLAGGAAVSVLARQHGIALTVVDCGVRHDFEAAVAQSPAAGTAQLAPRLLLRKVALGTADASQGPAMSAAQRAQALVHGAEVVRGLPGNALLLGEMGIGNTSAASLLLARLGDCDIAACVGAGTGLDAAGIARKREVLARVLALHAQARTPLQALAAFGGFEIAAMVGAVLQAAAERRVIVVDGFIASAAVLVAAHLAPNVVQRCVFAHRSGEAGHALMLDRIGACTGQPVHALLDLGLRLGEGSGAALAWPLLVSACAILREMATFDSAGVSGKTP